MLLRSAGLLGERDSVCPIFPGMDYQLFQAFIFFSFAKIYAQQGFLTVSGVNGK